MRIKTGILNYKDPNTGDYVSIPVIASGEDIDNKQNKTDEELCTNDKTIVGAINELHGLFTESIAEIAELVGGEA